MKIKWLQALYDFGPHLNHIAVTVDVRRKLVKMAECLAGTEDLVGIYIPEGTQDVYKPGAMRGRIVGAVRLLKMPEGKGIEDYFYHDWDQHDGNPEWDGTARWSVGWPCQTVLCPQPEMAPALRSLVEVAHPGAAFGTYVAQFQQGPIQLGFPMIQAITRAMVHLFGDPPWQ